MLRAFDGMSANACIIRCTAFRTFIFPLFNQPEALLGTAIDAGRAHGAGVLVLVILLYSKLARQLSSVPAFGPASEARARQSSGPAVTAASVTAGQTP